MGNIMTTTGTTADTTHPDALEDLHRDCFACGVCNRDGLNLHFHVGADGVAVADWPPSPAFRSYPDRVHGGVIATLLDSAIVHALFAKGVAGVTAEITIRYLQKVNVTDPVHVTGRVDANRHGVYLCSAEVHQAGALAVRASAKFMPLLDAFPHFGHADLSTQ